MFIELWETNGSRVDWGIRKYIDGLSIMFGFIDKYPDYDIKTSDEYLNKIIRIRTDKYFLVIKCTRNQYDKIIQYLD